MALLSRTVIERTKGAVPRNSTIAAELLAPAGLLPPAQVLSWRLTGWQHDGDHLRLNVDSPTGGLAVLVGPLSEVDGAFLRTDDWNIAYRDGAFSAQVPELLSEIGLRLQRTTRALGLNAAGIAAQWFVRPSQDDVLEVSPGKKLYVRVTDHCDEKCLFCNATEGNSNIIESKQKLTQILRGLPTGQLSQVIFSGGEPTLVKALPELVALAYERGSRQIIIQTNGVGLARPGALEAYLPFQDRLGIGFSLHATQAELSALMLDHSDVQRFDAKLVAIDRAVELGFLVKITCVVMKPNLAQVPDFARWVWQRWGAGIARLQFSYAMPRGNAWLNQHLLLKFSDCVEPFAQAYAMGREVGLRVETSQSACVPPCVMPDWIDHYDIYGDFGGGRVPDPERVKPPEICGGCNWNRICAGVWQRYIDVYGTSELQPIVDRPEPVVDIEDFLEAEVLDLTDC